jgi:hypothetical protein
MKRLLILATIVTFVLSCNKEDGQLKIDLSELSEQLDGQLIQKELFIAQSNNNQIVALSKSNEKEPTFDNAYILQMDNNIKKINRQQVSEYIFFEECIIVNSTEGLIFLGVDTDNNTSLLTKLKEKTVNGVEIKEFLGYGFSRLKNSWSLKVMDGEMSDAYDHLSSNSLLKKINSRINDNIEDGPGGGGNETCTSGGQGSSSCSVTEVFGLSCTVSCRDGYYACCNSSNTTCKCIKE